MNKRNYFVCGLGAILAMGTAQAAKKADSKPNVLYIIMDDMCDWAGYLGGNNQVRTPNLDRLAARGVSFSNAYTAVPLCNPSRTAMFTGIQPFVTGVYNNRQPIAGAPVANNSLMMPQHFRNNGYTTVISGKIFHTKPSEDVMAKMWDDKTNIDGGYGPFPKNRSLPVNIGERWKDFEAWTGPDTDFPDVRNSQKVIEFIGEKHDKPFFVAMGFYRPHTPWTAPKRYFDLYDINQIKRPHTISDDLTDIPAYAINNFIGSNALEKQKVLSKTGNYWEQMVRAYMACVSFADDRIGMILDALDKSPYADNTMIILVGDNGFHHGEKERWGKSALWREACHVPLIIVPPKKDNRLSKGICMRPVSSIDIYPTLIEACNLPAIKNQLAGNSLMPLLRNVNASWDKPSITTFLPGNFTIHSNRWNFIRYLDGSHELYNVQDDEGEFVNLAGNEKFRSTVDSLSAFLPPTWSPGGPNTIKGEEAQTGDESSDEMNATPRSTGKKRVKGQQMRRR